MKITYTTRNQKTYYLYRGTTKKGEPRYYFSPDKSRNDQLVDAIPEGYEIYENISCRLYLRKIKPKIILDEEIDLVKTELKKIMTHKDYDLYKVDVKKNIIIIYELNENIESIVECSKSITTKTEDEIREIVITHATYSPLMQFVLTNEKTRSFVVHHNYHIVQSNWANINDEAPLESHVRSFIRKRKIALMV
ncbi:MAG: hypothetical protein HQK75_03940 [Candidatus Magnetomorum sp.]|nr:hypothetical protein [Candidatus Magnetomorum sp.]